MLPSIWVSRDRQGRAAEAATCHDPKGLLASYVLMPCAAEGCDRARRGPSLCMHALQRQKGDLRVVVLARLRQFAASKCLPGPTTMYPSAMYSGRVTGRPVFFLIGTSWGQSHSQCMMSASDSAADDV